MTGAPPPKFNARQQSIQSLAAMTSAALGAVCGSFISDAGTFYGAVLGTAAFGSLVSGTAQWAYARLFHHAAGHVRLPKVNPGRAWLGGGVAVAGLAACLVAVTGFEGMSGQTLHAATTGSAQRGTTLGSVLDAHPVRPAPSILAPSSGTPAPSASVTLPPAAVSVTPGPSSTTPGPSGSPSAFSEPHPTSPATVPASPMAPVGGDVPAPTTTATTTAPQQQGAHQ